MGGDGLRVPPRLKRRGHPSTGWEECQHRIRERNMGSVVVVVLEKYVPATRRPPGLSGPCSLDTPPAEAQTSSAACGSPGHSGGPWPPPVSGPWRLETLAGILIMVILKVFNFIFINKY